MCSDDDSPTMSQVNNPAAPPDAPAGGGGFGHFRQARIPGVVGQDGEAPIALPLPIMTCAPVTTKELMRDLSNVGRPEDGKPLDGSFDWLSPFEADSKWVLIPDKSSAAAETLRPQMLQILTKTRLAQNIFLKLLKPMKPGIRDERAAWILRSGELGPVKTGTTQKVEQADKPVGGEIVGYVHIHPTLPTYLNPPSAGSMDSDYDKTLIEYPLQFVVESSKGRVWAQFPPRHACLLGRINVVTGAFQPLDAKELMAATVYKVISVDGWRLMEAMKPKDARGK